MACAQAVGEDSDVLASTPAVEAEIFFLHTRQGYPRVSS